MRLEQAFDTIADSIWEFDPPIDELPFERIKNSIWIVVYTRVEGPILGRIWDRAERELEK